MLARRIVLPATAAALLLLRGLPASLLRLLPPCPVHQVFGILCPGCGSTRALFALLHGDLASAWHSNPLFLLLLLPASAYLLLARDAPRADIPPQLTAALLVFVLAFGVLRNF